VRTRRIARKLSQHQLADRMKSSQSRVAKIESGSAGVSLDLMFRGLFAVGGKVSDLSHPPKPTRRKHAPPNRKKRTPA
jgi:transcriptional regulator with XRE-family HTH domain